MPRRATSFASNLPVAAAGVGSELSIGCCRQRTSPPKIISDDPCGSCYREIFCVAGPTEQLMRFGKCHGEPDEQSEANHHRGKQARREQGRAAQKQRDSREPKRNGGRYRPEHLPRRNPFGNETCSSREIKEM